MRRGGGSSSAGMRAASFALCHPERRARSTRSRRIPPAAEACGDGGSSSAGMRAASFALCHPERRARSARGRRIPLAAKACGEGGSSSAGMRAALPGRIDSAGEGFRPAKKRRLRVDGQVCPSTLLFMVRPPAGSPYETSTNRQAGGSRPRRDRRWREACGCPLTGGDWCRFRVAGRRPNAPAVCRRPRESGRGGPPPAGGPPSAVGASRGQNSRPL